MRNVKLTKTDRMILESYKPVLYGLASYLSPSYEVVLHSLEDYDHSVIDIINGEHTGRTVGAPITDLAINMLGEIECGRASGDSIVYFSHNRNGDPLKSTTIAIRGELGRIIGLICINLYLNVPFSTMISSFLPAVGVNGVTEDFFQDPDDLIRTIFEGEHAAVMADDTILPSNKNRAIVERLYDKGVFRLKDSVVKVEGLMGISKNTIYMHIRNYKRELEVGG